MKRLYFILYIAALVLLSNSCSLDDDGVNFYYAPLKIASVEVPESFILNEVYTIKVNIIRPDDCTLLEGFDVTKSATTTREVIAVGAFLEKEDCKTVDKEVQDTFQFSVIYSEPYLFRFFTGNDADGKAQYIEVEVPVN